MPNATAVAQFTFLVARADLTQENAKEYDLPLESWKAQDLVTNLSATSATTFLGLVAGTFGSASPMLKTWDIKATTVDKPLYCRRTYKIPLEYVSGQTLQFRATAGMVGAVADTSALLKVEVYKCDGLGGIGSQLVTTVDQNINSLSWTDFTFTINPAGMVAGDVLDIRITVTLHDNAGANPVYAGIGETCILASVKG